MAGIYLHIPFCKQACHYCDFHFSTNQQQKTTMVRAMVQEISIQKNYLGDDPVSTIYLGGGTPSLLTGDELQTLLSAVHENFEVTALPEITLEANPDDLTAAKLKLFKACGINRLSIGIQSFHNPHLHFLNRAHNADEARQCVKIAQEEGFDNISIDLIYAIPAEDHRLWQQDLQTAMQLHPQHISSYCLTIEEKTVFGQWLKKGRFREAEEDFAAEQFEILLHTLQAHGYEQYEISNFSLPGYHSRHNSNYWKKEKYLGIGPSAHSYDQVSRQYNVAHNVRYLKALAENRLAYEKEWLQPQDQINEYILTGLRTKWGCDLMKIKTELQYDLYAHNAPYIEDLIARGLATLQDQHLILTPQGKLLADRIASDLFAVS